MLEKKTLNRQVRLYWRYFHLILIYKTLYTCLGPDFKLLFDDYLVLICLWTEGYIVECENKKELTLMILCVHVVYEKLHF